MKKVFSWIADNINTQAFTNLYDSLLFVIDFVVSRTSDSLAGILIKALPLLAPVPNAVSVWRISQHAPLNYDTLQAGALAASVEGMFFALTEVVLNMFDGYLLDEDRYKWPLGIAVTILVAFFMLVEVIVYHIETNPIACAFPVISLIAAVALGCARWHKRGATSQPARKQVRKQPEAQPASNAVAPLAIVVDAAPVELVAEEQPTTTDAQAKQLDDVDTKILDAIGKGASTPYAIAKAVGMSQTTLKRKTAEGIYIGRLPELVQSGYVLNGGATYSLPASD